METTINMNFKELDLLNKASDLLGISRSRIIKYALKSIERNCDIDMKDFSMIKYQDKDLKENWKLFHLIITPSEYEHFTDMRNFYKMSLSLLIAFALNQYIDIIMKMNYKKLYTDNYLFPAYSLSYKIESGVKYFLICWGRREEEVKIGGKSGKWKEKCLF